MTYAFRSALLGIGGALVLACVASACSSTSTDAARSKEVATTGTTPGPIDVQISSLFITVENHAGQPLLDVHIVIRPVGRDLPFTTTIRRMESSERRDLSLGDFVAVDKTRFSAFTPPPKEVVVTAVDFVGKHHEVTVPWKR